MINTIIAHHDLIPEVGPRPFSWRCRSVFDTSARWMTSRGPSCWRCNDCHGVTGTKKGGEISEKKRMMWIWGVFWVGKDCCLGWVCGYICQTVSSIFWGVLFGDKIPMNADCFGWSWADGCSVVHPTVVYKPTDSGLTLLILLGTRGYHPLTKWNEPPSI